MLYAGVCVSINVYKRVILLDRLLSVNGNVTVLISSGLLVAAPYRSSLTLWSVSIFNCTLRIKSGDRKPPGEVMRIDDAHFPVSCVWDFYFVAQPVCGRSMAAGYSVVATLLQGPC